MWQSAQWRALCTKITEAHLSEFVYTLFHKDFSLINGTYYNLFRGLERSLHEKSVNKYR